MNRPDDISEALWNACGRIVNAQGHYATHEAIEPVARAIMAAEKRGEEREREAILYVVTPYNHRDTGREIYAAIRKRGEA